MRCVRLSAWTTLAVLAMPQFAAAGPIEWSMRGDIDYSRLGTELYLGAHLRELPNGQTEVVHAYGQMPEGMLPVGAGSQTRVGLGVQSKQGFRFDSAPAADPNANNEVLFNVWVTDAASGETGHLSFNLAAYLLTGLPGSDHSELAFGGEARKTLVLGGNRYYVEVKTGDSESNAWVYADVTVSANTPEPGTLALAGLGLGGVLIRRLRRR